MIYKFNNGGIVKLQNAGSVPEYGNIEQIAKYNREHGTNFWKMSQVLEYDKQQAQQKTQDKKKSFWEILAGHPESAGEAILNKTIETANNAELPETRKKIYNDTAISELGTTVGSLLTLPMLGEFSTYGLLGGSARLTGSMTGSDALNWGGGKVGGWVDKKLGTGFFEPVLSLAGLLKGWNVGGKYGYGAAKKILSNQMTRQMAKHGNMNIPKWWASKNMQRDVFLSDPYGKHVYDQWMKYNRNRPYTHPSKQLSNIDDQDYGFAFKNGGILKGQKGLSKALSGIFANASSERAASKAMSGVAKASGVSAKRPRIKVYQDLRKTAVKQTPLSTLNAEKNTAYQNKLLSENQEYQIKQTQQILDNYLQRQWTEKGVNTPGWMRKALMKAIGINPLASTPPFETPYTTGYRSWYRNGQPLMFEGEPVKDWMNASGDYFNIGPHSEMFQAVKPLKSASNYFDIVGQNVKGEAYQTNMDMFKEGLQNLVDLYFK